MVRKGLTGGSYQPLTSGDITKIHETVLKVFEEIGCEINSAAALDALEKAGARVDRATRRVRLSPEQVMDFIDTNKFINAVCHCYMRAFFNLSGNIRSPLDLCCCYTRIDGFLI